MIESVRRAKSSSRKDGSIVDVEVSVTYLQGSDGRFFVFVRDLTMRKAPPARSGSRTLSGFLPICSSCKMIRDGEGHWQRIEIYIRDRSEAEFTHSICPECARRLYPAFLDPAP